MRPGAVDHVLGGWTLGTISYLDFRLLLLAVPSRALIRQIQTPLADCRIVSPMAICPAASEATRAGSMPRHSAFPRRARFGNSGPNVLVGQGINVHHLGLAKRFRDYGTNLDDLHRPDFRHLQLRRTSLNPTGNISVPATVGQIHRRRVGLRSREGQRTPNRTCVAHRVLIRCAIPVLLLAGWPARAALDCALCHRSIAASFAVTAHAKASSMADRRVHSWSI